MAELSIPELIKPILERIALMSDAEFGKMESALATISPSLSPEDTEHSIPYLSDVIRAVVSMNMGRSDTNIPTEQFARDVAKAFKKKGGQIEKSEAFLERIHRLLSIKSLVLSSRAIDVHHGQSAHFVSSRIFSEVRPVFDSTGEKPLGALIVHNLKMVYYQNNKRRELFMALDSADLSALRKVLDRAEIKTSGIESLLKKTGIEYFRSQ